METNSEQGSGQGSVPGRGRGRGQGRGQQSPLSRDSVPQRTAEPPNSRGGRQQQRSRGGRAYISVPQGTAEPRDARGGRQQPQSRGGTADYPVRQTPRESQQTRPPSAAATPPQANVTPLLPTSTTASTSTPKSWANLFKSPEAVANTSQPISGSTERKPPTTARMSEQPSGAQPVARERGESSSSSSPLESRSTTVAQSSLAHALGNLDVSTISVGDQGSSSREIQNPPVTSKVFQIPRRPVARRGDNLGSTIQVRANHFIVEYNKSTDLHHYDVAMTPESTCRRVNRAVIKKLVDEYRFSRLGSRLPAYDGRKNLYTAGKLPGGPNDAMEFDIDLRDEDFTGWTASNTASSVSRVRTYKVVLKLVAKPGLNSDGRGPAEILQSVLQVYDIVLREQPTNRYSPIGRSFFSREQEHIDLGSGVEAWQGFYQSMRNTQMGLSLNLDTSSTAFVRQMPVIDFLMAILKANFNRLKQILSGNKYSDDRTKAQKFLQGLKVEVTHRTTTQKFRITGLSDLPTSGISFDVDECGTTEKKQLTKYFQETYAYEIRFPSLPCLRIGNREPPNYLPMEVCTILQGQRYSKKLNDTQINNMLKFATHNCRERVRRITSIVETNAYASDLHAVQFGIKVSKNLTLVPARCLPVPTLKYGNNSTSVPSPGKWTMQYKRLARGGTVKSCAFVNFSNVPKGEVCDFGLELSKKCEEMGMTFNPRSLLYFESRVDHMTDLLKEVVHNNPNLDLFVIILPDTEASNYGKVKWMCDTVVGVPSQCCQSNHVMKKGKWAMYLTNLILKINVKIGGQNAVLADTPPVMRVPTILFGADVTHPPPGQDGGVSIAAVVASQDWPETARYAGLMSVQESRQEIIQDIGGMVKKLLSSFRAAAGLLPQKIIFYRDGVSEGQFQQVLEREVLAIQQACASIEASIGSDYKPSVTFVVVQKRHHTRLFPNTLHADKNLSAGTVVDSLICHPTEFDFYLCSHDGIKGTSRPAHYHVLYDENNFGAHELQSLTYNLCYTFARCTKSVSFVPPAYYAHLAAFRARFYLAAGSGVADLPAVKEKVSRGMFFC